MAQLEHRRANRAAVLLDLVMLVFLPDEIGTIMRKLFLLPLAIALTQVAAFAAPQSAQTDPSLSEIQVRGAMPIYKLQPAQVDEVKGVYVLDNGLTFKITNVNRKLFAQLGQRQIAELVAVSETQFVSPDQRITMEYRPLPFNDEIVLTYPSDLSVASSELVTVRLAANQ